MGFILFTNLDLFQVKQLNLWKCFRINNIVICGYLELFMEHENFSVALIRGINVNCARGHLEQEGH